MKPLLAHIYEPHRVTYPCYVQPKLNGIRALYQAGHFQSRHGEPWKPHILAHLAKPLSEVFGPDVILDGELYVHGWSLQRILGAVTPVRNEPTEETVKVKFHIFDVVNFQQSFQQRLDAQLPKISFIQHAVNWVETNYVGDAQDADDAYAEYVKLGYEGMMYRLGDCPYTEAKQPFYEHALGAGTFPGKSRYLSDKDNRVWHMLKRKNWLDDEFPFLSLNTTVGDKGERGFQMWLATPTGARFKVSSGLTEAEVDRYLENPPTGRMVKVKYLVLSADGIPLNATILAIL